MHTQLRRLARGYGTLRGGRWAARWHLVVLLLAVGLAFLSRAVRPLPGISWLAGHPLAAVGAGLGLLLLGWLLTRLAAHALRPRDHVLARQLDERYAWHDETQTAVGLEAGAGERPLAGLLIAQTHGRLRELSASDLTGEATPWRWPRRLLAFLFVFVLLAPGVDGLLGRLGAGHGGDGLLGTDGVLEPIGAPRPMRADFWLQTFVQNPLPVEPLASEPGVARDDAGTEGRPKK